MTDRRGCAGQTIFRPSSVRIVIFVLTGFLKFWQLENEKEIISFLDSDFRFKIGAGDFRRRRAGAARLDGQGQIIPKSGMRYKLDSRAVLF